MSLLNLRNYSMGCKGIDGYSTLFLVSSHNFASVAIWVFCCYKISGSKTTVLIPTRQNSSTPVDVNNKICIHPCARKQRAGFGWGSVRILGHMTVRNKDKLYTEAASLPKPKLFSCNICVSVFKRAWTVMTTIIHKAWNWQGMNM